jgi:DNA-binding LytR/AlgR family response regulator
MRCIIVEDQPPAQRILKKYVADYGALELLATFPDAVQALEFLKSNTVDLIFLDIHLPRISGLEFLKSLKNPPHVILTTAFPDYALESYELDVVDYLLKPFSFQRFVKAVGKIPVAASSEEAAPPPPQELFIKSGYEWIRIQFDDIILIKSDADYTELLLAEARHLSSEPLRYWEETLPANQFVRIHKSYIIHTGHIQKISANQVHLSANKTAPIGRSYKEGFLERIKRIG